MRPLAALALLAAPAVTAPPVQVGEDAALDPTRVAIELADGAEPALDALSDRLGVTVRSARVFGPESHRLVELDGALAGPDRDARLRAVAALPEVRFATPVWTGTVGLPEFPTRFVLARFHPGSTDPEQRAAIEGAGLVVDRAGFGAMENAWRLRADVELGTEVVELAAALAARSDVAWAHPDRVLGTRLHDFVPDDPLFDDQWALQNTGQLMGGEVGVDMNLPPAWDVEQGDPSIRVAVFDNGAQLDHPDLPVAFGINMTDVGPGGGAPVAWNACHGTAVAGVIGASIDNGIGVAGVAPNVQVGSIAVLKPDGGGACTNDASAMASWYVGGLVWAEVFGARVSNWSISFGEDDAVKDKLSETRADGMVHFSSSGNSYPDPIGFPANYWAVNAVGSMASNGGKAGSSQTGPKLAFAGPGVSIRTTDRTGSAGYNTMSGSGGDYTWAGGTSFASPNVAGVAALVLSHRPSLSPTDVELALRASADDHGPAGFDEWYGHGMPNAHEALAIAEDLVAGWVLVDAGLSFPPIYYPTVAAGHGALTPGGLLLVAPDSYAESVVLTKPLVIRPSGAGTVVIGE